MVHKPVVVVPNHMLEQFAREWLQIYPQSRVLAASGEDLAGDRRRQFVARVAANDWDAVIMTRSAFTRLPVSTDTEAGYERQQVAQLRAMLERAKGDRGLTVKLIEKQIARREQDLKAKLDAPRDSGISFESTGLDYVLCDEAHDCKNLKTDSNIRDASITGSKRASDLHMKLEYLRSRHGARIATLATATPIANSITEAHVMSRYLRPDLLARAGVEDFDSWAATFGQTVTEIEIAPTGGGDYRMHTRFARFANVPEMLRSTWHGFADVKTGEDLGLPVPELAQRPDGQRAPIAQLIAASPELTGYVQQLGERAEKVRSRSVDPTEDNMLKITGDGRKAALDMRLVTGQPASAPGKLQAAAANIARLYHATRAREYLDPVTGRPSSTPGALQIVFCDLSTPGGEGWNAYDQLRDELADRGLPVDRVRYIHQARDDLEKARLFAACRAGHVNVILGSTQKMGVGTNIQNARDRPAPSRRSVAPADVAQRDGRIKRQANQNPEVGIYRYVTEGSFDTYMWQTVERKARFINQLMRGRLDVREIEDLGEDVIGFAELKAIASGDPLILQKAKIDAEVERLGRVHRAWQRGHHALRSTITAGEQRAAVRERQLAGVNQALPRVRDTRGDLFKITINDSRLNADSPTRTAPTRPPRSRPACEPSRPGPRERSRSSPASTSTPNCSATRPESNTCTSPSTASPPSPPRSNAPNWRRPVVADPPARASGADPPGARRPARQRARGRAPRERRGARAARPPVQVRRPARRRAPPATADRRADQHPPRADRAARTRHRRRRRIRCSPPVPRRFRAPRAGGRRPPCPRQGPGLDLPSRPPARGPPAGDRPFRLGRGMPQTVLACSERGLGDLDHDRLLQQLLDERAQLGGVIEQARPRMRHPRNPPRTCCSKLAARPGASRMCVTAVCPDRSATIGGDQRQRMSLQNCDDRDDVGARVLDRARAPLGPRLAAHLDAGQLAAASQDHHRQPRQHARPGAGREGSKARLRRATVSFRPCGR